MAKAQGRMDVMGKMAGAKGVMRELDALADAKKAKILSGFFKTGKGEYGEGDVFLGVKVPEQRIVAAKFRGMELIEIEKLLESKIHEHRLTGLLILVDDFKKADDNGRKKTFEFYLENTKKINNWDLVDLSAPNIAGEYVLLHPDMKKLLRTLSKSKNLWERRIAIISTFAFIRKGEFNDALEISEMLLSDRHDLIHKAVGWMLREIGKRDIKAEEAFLKKQCRRMPRTMLRYAIERFGSEKKAFYMAK